MSIDIKALQQRIQSRTGQRVDIVFVNYVKPCTDTQDDSNSQLKRIGEKSDDK